jgi:hypothetical protein
MSAGSAFKLIDVPKLGTAVEVTKMFAFSWLAAFWAYCNSHNVGIPFGAI